MVKCMTRLLPSILLVGSSAASAEGLSIPLIGESTREYDLSIPAERQSFQSVMEKEPVTVAAAVSGKGETNKVAVTSKKTVGQTSVLEVANIVKELRASVCTSLKKGDSVKFAMSWDASAKVWGIGVSGQSGVEVLISCSSK